MTQQIKEINMNIKLSPNLQFLKYKETFNSTLQFQIRCNLSIYVSRSILNNQKRKCQNAKCIFLYFQYKGMKMKGLDNKLIYRPYCKQKRQAK